MHIEHAAMYVTDLARAKAFFITYLDARAGRDYHNPKTDFRSCFLSFDDGARLELMQRPDVPQRKDASEFTGYAHLAFCLGSRERVDALTQRLRQAGYAVVSGPRTTGDGYYESCVLDAEGNRLEFTI